MSRRPPLTPATEPAIACSLTAGQQADRVAQWAGLLTGAGGRSATADGVAIDLGTDPRLAAQAADLAVREQQCCPFLTFSLDVGADGVRLTVRAPAEARDLVESLFGA